VGELSAPGYVVAGPLNYQATYYTRLVAYDSSGNASDPSAQAVLVVAPLVDVSNFPDDAMQTLYARTGHFIDLTADNFSANLIKGMWIDAGAITADKLTIGASGGQTSAENGYMEDLQEGSTTWPRNWTLVYQNGAQPTYAMDEATPISGRRSFRLNGIPTDCGSTWINQYPDPGYLPVVAGQKWYMRATVRASRALTQTDRFGLRFHTSQAPSNPDGLFDPNVTWASVGTPALGVGVTVVESTFTVPANHTRMRAGFWVNGDSSGTYDLTVDSIEMWPATTDAQVTEIGAGKIVTGVLQATQRIVAGSLTGARAELNGVGFQAFNPSGIKMFEVQATSGDTYVGDSGGIHMMLGAYSNWWNGDVSTAMLKFRAPTWGEGQLFAQYWTEGAYNIGALRLQSPYVGDPFANAAYLDVRNRSDGYSQFFLRATEANFTANTFIMGSSDQTTVDFRLSYAPGFTFSNYDMSRRLQVSPGIGNILLRGIDQNGFAMRTTLQGVPVVLSSGGADLEYAQGATSNPIFRHFGRNLGLAIGADRWRVVTYNDDVFQPIAASAFVVNSDPRTKANAEPVTGALGAIREMAVYDYDMAGALPRTSGPAIGPQGAPQGAQNRARGLMADELARVLPDAVNRDAQGQWSVSMYDLLATAVAGLQELAAQVDTLKAAQSPKKP
jgi:hypothetical protein